MEKYIFGFIPFFKIVFAETQGSRKSDFGVDVDLAAVFCTGRAISRSNFCNQCKMKSSPDSRVQSYLPYEFSEARIAVPY